MLLAQEKRRYLRSPRWVRRGNQLTLTAIAWRDAHQWPGHECVLIWPVDGNGQLGDPEASEAHPAIQALDSEARIVEGDDRHAECESASAHIECHDGISRVWLEHGAQRTLVWSAKGSAAAPAVLAANPASEQSGHWVAWHHDVREDTGDVDVAKWITLRFVASSGSVLEPAQPMLGIERDLEGEEQGFEFPELVEGLAGAIRIYGRGSHNFWRQDLNASGWSERVALGEGSWGSRGRRLSATLSNGQVLTARREGQGLLIECDPAPEGGAPTLSKVERINLKTAPTTPRVPGRPTGSGKRVFFGDIQQHSAHSDGVGTADEAYLRARWRYDDDFVALTDHESFIGKRTGPGEWDYLQSVADRHNAPGEFATLLAYEWTGKRYPGPGHKCVYPPSRGMPLVSRDEFPSGAQAVQRLKELGAIASPHHIGWTGCDEDGHDPVGQPVWEICSCHGCYEHADHPLGMRGDHSEQLVDVMLRKGHRFGFTASSDSHGLLWHHGESRKRDPYRTGLTAVLCEELTREAILQALRHRRCYATSGVKMVLDFEVNEQPMGAELNPTDSLRVRAEATGVTPLSALELVGPNGVVHRHVANGLHATLQLEVPACAFLYLRVVQHDGEMAWASPVFVDVG